MADAFASLVWDEIKPGNQSNTSLGAQQQQQQQKSQLAGIGNSDSFGRLAAAGGTSSNAIPTRSIPSRASPAPARGVSSPSNGDPFGGLIAFGGSPNINMSMADRRAHAEREKRERERKERQKLDSQAALWDQLDGNLSISSSKASSRAVSPAPIGLPARSPPNPLPPAGLKTNPNVNRSPGSKLGSGDLFWNLSTANNANGTSRTASPAVPSYRQSPAIPSRISSGRSEPTLASSSVYKPQSNNTSSDAWSMLDVLAAPKPVPAAVPKPDDPFDLDFLAESPKIPTAPSNPILRSQTRTPGEFDFNESEHSSRHVHTDDDILGDLAKPVEEVVQSSSQRNSRAGTLNSSENRTSSPPPHVIGRIVEMGFTPQQARMALATTDTGIDVEAALEMLLALSANDEQSDISSVDSSRMPSRARSRARGPDEVPQPRASGTSTPSSQTAQNGLAAQIQPDKLLAQASEIGFSMFNKANAFWNQGKEKVQKAYEERTKASNVPSTSDGRPKWMTADVGYEAESSAEAPSITEAVDSRFKDVGSSSGTEVLERRTTEPASALPAPRNKTTSLFEDDSTTYVSPHRRRPAPSAPRASLNSNASKITTAPKPPSRVQIIIPETSPAALASCVSSRSKGTEMFKLGRYGEAETAYSTAISSIPSTHILLTVLYTNRAASRLKTGDSGGAVGDCTNAFKLMGIGEDMKGLLDIEDGTRFKFDGVPGKLDLREQAVKALQRRAAAFEMMERWERARTDWERLAGLTWNQALGKVKDEAARAAARCRTMANAAVGVADLPTSKTPLPTKSRPPARRPLAKNPQVTSDASLRLKAAEAAQEAEDVMRIQLKDAVDARIQAWKGGKETNLRALIASLDAVLWPEVGWVKVGMHELVTPSQVKIRYTKAIAKVHPDKLSVGNPTVEQKMLANGIFGGLNEAWMAFKQ